MMSRQTLGPGLKQLSDSTFYSLEHILPSTRKPKQPAETSR